MATPMVLVATLPLFYEKADSPAMVKHTITLLMIQFLHVDSLSSPKLNIYRHAFQICWNYLDGAHCWYKLGLQNPVQQIHTYRLHIFTVLDMHMKSLHSPLQHFSKKHIKPMLTTHLTQYNLFTIGKK